MTDNHGDSKGAEFFFLSSASLYPRSMGYPAMCTWMASDDDFFVLRRFGKLGARVALQMQDHIVRLEEELENEDRQCRDCEQSSGSLRDDPSERRQEILEELTVRIGSYRMPYYC